MSKLKTKKTVATGETKAKAVTREGSLMIAMGALVSHLNGEIGAKISHNSKRWRTGLACLARVTSSNSEKSLRVLMLIEITVKGARSTLLIGN